MRAEDALQIRCKKWLTEALPLEVVWSGIEHAQQMTVRQGAIRKAKGVKRGLPDMLFWWGGKSVAVELKTPEGRQSEDQRDFMVRFRAAGGIYAVCRSEQDVELVLRAAEFPVRIPAPAPWVSLPSAGPSRTRSSLPQKRTPRDAGKLRAIAKARAQGAFV